MIKRYSDFENHEEVEDAISIIADILDDADLHPSDRNEMDRQGGIIAGKYFIKRPNNQDEVHVSGHLLRPEVFHADGIYHTEIVISTRSIAQVKSIIRGIEKEKKRISTVGMEMSKNWGTDVLGPSIQNRLIRYQFVSPNNRLEVSIYGRDLDTLGPLISDLKTYWSNYNSV